VSFKSSLETSLVNFRDSSNNEDDQKLMDEVRQTIETIFNDAAIGISSSFEKNEEDYIRNQAK
jgi:hypothetical protein